MVEQLRDKVQKFVYQRKRQKYTAEIASKAFEEIFKMVKEKIEKTVDLLWKFYCEKVTKVRNEEELIYKAKLVLFDIQSCMMDKLDYD